MKIELMGTGLGAAVSERRSGLASERAFLVTSGLLFTASLAVTIYWSRSMSGIMPASGDMASSPVWSRMPGQTWLGAATSFMGMWIVMMAAMMLPSLASTLLGYRRMVRGQDQVHLGWLTAMAGSGYFFVWLAFGAVAYPFGALLVAAETRWTALAHLAPFATGIVLLLAGCFQLTAWKSHQLECCRNAPAHAPPQPPGARNAWQYGLRLGAHCVLCCTGFMTVLLVTGVMDLALMAIIAAAITIERLAPGPVRLARTAGIVIIAAGIVVAARALSMA